MYAVLGTHRDILNKNKSFPCWIIKFLDDKEKATRYVWEAKLLADIVKDVKSEKSCNKDNIMTKYDINPISLDLETIYFIKELNALTGSLVNFT